MMECIVGSITLPIQAHLNHYRLLFNEKDEP